MSELAVCYVVNFQLNGAWISYAILVTHFDVLHLIIIRYKPNHHHVYFMVNIPYWIIVTFYGFLNNVKFVHYIQLTQLTCC
ncbi:hypothetical protein EDB71_102166 [Vibrio crassostreae]|nr:hypothetical protein EDB71_102166 [Vibrio crassostreae]